MVPWILSDEVIITLLKYMDRHTSLAFICAAKFLQPYINTLDHIKKISVACGDTFTITYSGKLSLLKEFSRRNGHLNRKIVEIVKNEKILIRKIKCGEKHVAAITSTGKLILWGDNKNGQCSIPLKYLNNRNVKFRKVCCSNYSTAVMTTTGKIIIFGEYRKLQTIIPYIKNDVFSKISLGYNHMAAITSSGKLVVWGDNSRGQCNIPPSHINATFSKVSCGSLITMATTTTGETMIFVYARYLNSEIQHMYENNFRKISCYDHVTGITLSGKLLIWGKCGKYHCFVMNYINSPLVFSKIKCAEDNTTALTSSGKVIEFCNYFTFHQYIDGNA